MAGAALTAVPGLAQEPAKSVDDFVDRIGVATHWGYPDTPYGYAYDKVKQLLGESGIRHVRDGYHERENDLYKTYGIKTTVIFGPGQQPSQIVDLIKKHIGIFAMVEGPNEVDIFPTSANYKGKGFPEGPINFQNEMYAAIKADPATAHLEVIAPSTARMDSNLRLAPLRSMDYTVMHSYAGGGPPGASLEGGYVSNILNAGRILGTGAVLKPIVVTESGYHTAMGANTVIAGVQPGVSLKTHAKYIPRHYAEYFNAGIVRTIVYEFINEFKDEATNAEASFGLVQRDLTPKPAYFALKNLIALLGEARWNAAQMRWQKPAFTPRALNFTLEGDTKNVHHTLLQKSNGDYYLLLWQEVSSFDTKTKTDINNPNVAVTLKLNTRITAATTYLPGTGTQPQQSFRAPRSLTLNVPDELLIVKLTPEPPTDTGAPSAPKNLTGTATGTAITLNWNPSLDNRKNGVAGYFVSRLGRYLGRTTTPTFTDSKLIPGTGYTYEVQAYDRAGNLSLPVTTVVMTRNEFPDLVLTDFSWTPANPKPGDAVTFSGTIKNIGNAPTPAGTTHGLAFHVDGGIVNWSDTFNEALAPGATRALTANNGPKGTNTWTATPGTHQIAAHLDDLNRITESNETNNKMEKTLNTDAQ